MFDDELVKLLQHEERLRGAPELASFFGATQVCFFIRDPELKQLLPALGFPQHLRKGASWAKFLQEIERNGRATDKLYSPFSSEEAIVTGSLLSRDACIVLFGEGVNLDCEGRLANSLRVFAALLAQEIHTNLAEIRAGLSSQIAAESRQLTTALSKAHDLLSEALQSKEDLLETIQKKDERLRQVRHIAGIGTWEFDPIKDQIEISPEVQAIYGIADASPIGINDLLAKIHPSDRENVHKQIDAAYRQRTEYRIKFRVVPMNGSVRWVEDRGTVAYNPDRRLHTIVGFSLDITQRVLTEEALIRSEKLSAAGRLAASIAHELNNPLEALVNLIFIARTAAKSDEVREMLTQADDELIRIAAVTRQALAFYRDVGAPTRFDAGLAVAQTVDIFSKDLRDAQMTLTLELPSQMTKLLGWPGEIKQAVSNLLSNAIRVSAPGSILRVRVREALGNVRIVVGDQGHGINQEHLARIFEPFFTIQKGSGSGLGLWITQQIIAKHGGSIRARSQENQCGHGTVFLIKLPLHHEFTAESELHQQYRHLAGEIQTTTIAE